LNHGKRRDKDFLVLWKSLQQFDIARYYTDDWGSYAKYIPKHQHQIGKDETGKIERNPELNSG
jgi:insertion element IS1 protein InsB